MCDTNKKIVIEVDANSYSVIEEYSNYANQTEEFVVNQLFNHTLKEFQTKYANLKQGYIEMGTINLEISNAFTESENEAYNLIDY